jgi:predicted membrane channel-forming protein YqfA (hemolysin III family)
MSNILYIGAGMSYEERGQWVYVIVTVVAVAAYVVLIVTGAGGEPLTEVDYVPIMLWTIGVGIVGSILGRILAAIVWHGEGHETDVRDRDIDRRGEYIGGVILGIGMVVPFVLAITEADYFWIANAMYLVFAVAAVVSAAMKLIFYRRGL